MQYTFYLNNDATIYEKYPTLNTGLDEILEIKKEVSAGTAYPSRIVIKPDLTQLVNYISEQRIPSASYTASLNLHAIDMKYVPLTYSIEGYALAQSWTMGSGKYVYSPSFSDGVTWKTTNAISSSTWNPTNYQHISGGGSWLTSSIVTQSFTYSPIFNDLNLNITPIVQSWLHGSYTNNGIILKMSSSLEYDLEEMTAIQYYSSETNTIYPPKLIVGWDDSSYTTGSLSILEYNDATLIMNNLKQVYDIDTIGNFRLYIRSKYPQRTFAVSSSYSNTNYILGQNMYYGIEDYYSGTRVIDFSDWTKMSCDGTSYVFNLDFNSLIGNRMYRFVYKFVSGNNVYFFKHRAVITVK